MPRPLQLRSPEIPARVLIADDDRSFSESFARLLTARGYSVVVVDRGSQAMDAASQSSARGVPFGIILIDRGVADVDGMEVISMLRRMGETGAISMMCAIGTIDDAVSAMRSGADDFIVKSSDLSALLARVERVISPLDGAGASIVSNGLVGQTPAMVEVGRAIVRLARSARPVLVLGERGTGKATVARAIHQHSPRANRPFVDVGCAEVPPQTLERQLFGATTGRVSSRGQRSAFELAAGGSVLLRDVDALPLALQERLMPVIRSNRLVRGGSSRARQVSCRCLFASSSDLRRMVDRGSLMESLWESISAHSVQLSSLRERASDIPLLLTHVLGEHHVDGGGSRAICSAFAMRLLRDYHWPGNVSEFLETARSAATQADGGMIQAHHLPETLRATNSRANRAVNGDVEPHRYRQQTTMAAERANIVSALAVSGGSRSRAAQLLGMGRTTLWRRLRAHGMIGDTPTD